MAIADKLLDQLDDNKGDSEKAKAASNIVDSGIEYLIGAGITKGELSLIDLDSLDISCPINCVLGQLFRGYDIGLASLRMHFDDDRVGELGFCSDVVNGLDIDSELLTEVWRSKLKEMR